MKVVLGLQRESLAEEVEKCRRLQTDFFFHVFTVMFVDSTFLGGIIYFLQNPCWFHYIFKGRFNQAVRDTQTCSA